MPVGWSKSDNGLSVGAGHAGVAKALAIYRPTGQILCALVDGAGTGSATAQINPKIGAEIIDI